jgi:hypothetical protein
MVNYWSQWGQTTSSRTGHAVCSGHQLGMIFSESITPCTLASSYILEVWDSTNLLSRLDWFILKIRRFFNFVGNRDLPFGRGDLCVVETQVVLHFILISQHFRKWTEEDHQVSNIPFPDWKWSLFYSYVWLGHECGFLSPRHGASSGCGWRKGLLYGG